MGKDIFFKDYQDNDPKNIPLERDEAAIQERLKQEKYEQILRNQQMSDKFTDSFDDYSTSSKNIYNQPVRNNSMSYNQPDYGQQSYNRQPIYENPHYDDIATNNPPPKKKKKKKNRGCSSVFICFLLIIALLSGGTFGYVYSLCSKMNYVDEQRPDTNYQQYRDSSVYNVLLIGVDKETDGASRSDSMILVSLDKNNRVIKMTSFMRDMWVEIPDNGSAKLNAAFAYGGANLLMQTIEQNFDIYIDNYMLVNFDMFQQLIDGLGGVTVEITESEANFINRTSHAKVQPGINTLNGDYALIYCRIRKLDSDFMRTQRQRKVMTAIIHQMTTQSPTKTVGAVSSILPLITTDISPLSMTLKVFGGVVLLGYSNDQLRIPCDDTYDSRYVQGQAALVPDLDTNKQALHEFIYG